MSSDVRHDLHSAEPSAEPTVARPARRRKFRRVLAIVGASLVGALLVAVITFVFWANDTFAAERGALDGVRDDERVSLRTSDGFVVMTPTAEANGRGVVFLAGAKVDPDAYAATFQDVVADGTTVVIVRPFLNLALFETRPFDVFTAQAPDVTDWAVGGHSQGGVKACGYATSPEVSALILLASYCSLDDLSDRGDLSVLTLSGSQDGLISAEALADARALLPESAQYSVIPGATHAQFGAYGLQPGDGTSLLSDLEARALISNELVDFTSSLTR